MNQTDSEFLHVFSRSVGRSRLLLLHGEITENGSTPLSTRQTRRCSEGRVDGAIHRVGGPEIMAECHLIGHCGPVDTVRTSAGELAAQHVIHTVGPLRKGGGAGEAAILKSGYQRTLQLASTHNVRTIAFPFISTVIYGYPKEKPH